MVAITFYEIDATLRRLRGDKMNDIISPKRGIRKSKFPMNPGAERSERRCKSCMHKKACRAQVNHAVAEAQKVGGTCAFVDAEHALDPSYAKKLGVNVEDLLISQPDAGEQALEIADTLVRSGAIDVLVVDSVAALVPRAELEGEMWSDPRRHSRRRLGGPAGFNASVRMVAVLPNIDHSKASKS